MSPPAPDDFPTVDITYAGRSVALADLPEYRKFYGKLASGRWEPNTFAFLGRYLDAGTVLIDIGAWIGVTPFWSAAIAKAVVAVEPDPRCAGILKRLARDHDTVTVLEGALANRASVAIHAVEGFGSSETSVLDIGDGERATVRGYAVAEIMALASSGPVVVKVDIEGYEYLIGGELASFRGYPVKAMQIAVHPQLYERSLKGGRLARRLRTALATWQLARRFRPAFSPPSLLKYSSLATYIVYGILFRRTPKGADLHFRAVSDQS